MPLTTHQAVAWPTDQVTAVVCDPARLATCLPGAIVRREEANEEAPSVMARIGPGGDVEVNVGLLVRGDGRHSIVDVTATPTRAHAADAVAVQTWVTRLAQQLAANLEGLLATAPQPVGPATAPPSGRDPGTPATAPWAPVAVLRRLCLVLTGVAATWVALRLRRRRRST